MPSIDPKLSSVLTRALSNRVLSQAEADKITKAVEEGGVTPDEVQSVVSTLTQALANDGLDLSTSTRTRTLEKLLARLDGHHPTGLAAPAGGMSFVDALVLRAQGGPVPAPGGIDGVGGTGGTGSTGGLEERPLPKPGFFGQALEVEPSGRLFLDGNEVKLDPRAPTAEQVDAVMGLLVPGNLAALSDDEKRALADKLLAAVDAGWPLDPDGSTTFKRLGITVGAVAALRELAPALHGAQVDKLLDVLGRAPNAMARSLALDALDKAVLDDRQRARRDSVPAPEHKSTLVRAWDEMAKGQARIKYSAAEGEIQQVALLGLCFAKAPESVEGLYAGLAAFKDLNPGVRAFDAEESGHLLRLLEAYTQEHGALEYVFGTFEGEMPKELAKLTNERVTKALLPGLDAPSPQLLDVPLTAEQAAFVKTLLPGLKDDAAAKSLASVFKEAAQLTSTTPRGWGEPAAPRTPIPPAAFDLLQRVAKPYVEGREGTADGMMAVSDLARAVRSSVDEIRETLTPRLKSLERVPPTWNGIEVSYQTAKLLEQLAKERVRSSMSVTNLDKGLKVIADQNGGKVTGAASDVFAKMIADYMANWPELTTFDFNKLERIAKFAAEGKDVPLCTLNGKPVGLADFYGAVAQAVTDSIDRSLIRHEWMAHRWGYRAQASVEILDVIAEKTARDEGPVVALRRQFPGKQIEVLATGLDGEHQQFLYVVKDGAREIGVYNEGSDGRLAAYRDRKDPVLFTAVVKDDGALDVKVPSHNAVRKYPLQTPFGVGDSIDVTWLDSTATEVRTEGQKFDTRYKVLEGKIRGFDAAGNYEVEVRRPDGTTETQTLSLTKIKQANQPHYFSETGSYLRDVQINLTNDATLREFLQGADPIIQKYLPTDGSLAGIDAQELANLQRKCVSELMAYCAKQIIYPRDKGSSDANSERYWELENGYRFPLGELVKIGRGTCRHQCIALHLLLQRAGIDSRLASGAANTSSGNYRGLHLWVELSLADNSRWLSDQTWNDPYIPLWNGAYDVDKRRVEIYNRTTDFDINLAQ